MENIKAKNEYQAQLFSNRLSKNFKQLKKWARKNRVTCYRLYDKDIPEIPLCADLYAFLPADIETKMEAAAYYARLNSAIAENKPEVNALLADEAQRTYLHLYLYERPYEKDEEEEKQWLKEMSAAAAKVLAIPETNIILKTRKKQTENKKRAQYEKQENEVSVKGTVFEQGQLFYVNLSDYIDTGLFFDHRPLRAMVRQQAQGKRVLNLFSYTSSFSVYAAEGKASFIESVDLSNTYTEWSKNNMALNGFEGDRYSFISADVIQYLYDREKEADHNSEFKKFDLIVLDPPTFSNSKKTDTMLDINRDWCELVRLCSRILTEDGILYFSTNSRKLVFDENKIPANAVCREITQKTIPEDYRNTKIHRVWEIKFSKEY
ncbi:MAG: class I SAM-dependent methyltransferase [Treponema sp.]|nr:class I SAM-dependent methyltransferase [Spirochaetia bacterium]MDD7459369.1 class I SAM-dependent methyltransferase [Spirochaetales bacterium]MDY5810381.1 class I SAM-dependent methyltransferase [Treponema sp.]